MKLYTITIEGQTYPHKGELAPRGFSFNSKKKNYFMENAIREDACWAMWKFKDIQKVNVRVVDENGDVVNDMFNLEEIKDVFVDAGPNDKFRAVSYTHLTLPTN